MKPLIILIVLTFSVFAELPKKRNHFEFKALWENSPFTTKPIQELEKESNALEDWVLAGVSVNPRGGHTVTIINKKDRSDRKRIHSTEQHTQSSAKGFKILEVDQKGLDYKETRVKLSSGQNTGWVTYDENLIKVKPAVTPSVKPNPANATKANSRIPELNQNNSTSTPATTRRPRIRRVRSTPERVLSTPK